MITYGTGTTASVTVPGGTSLQIFTAAANTATQYNFSTISGATLRSNLNPTWVAQAMSTTSTSADSPITNVTATASSSNTWVAINIPLLPGVATVSTPQDPIRWLSTGAGKTWASTGNSWLQDIPFSADSLVVVISAENTTLTPNLVNAANFSGYVGDSSYPLTFLGASPSGYTFDGYYSYIVILGCLNPPTGNGITVSITNTSAYCAANSMAYSGVGSMVFVGGIFGPPMTSPQFFAAAADGEMLVGGIAGYTGTFTNFTQNQRSNIPYQSSVNLALVIGDTLVQDGDGALFGATHSGTWPYAAAAVSLKPKTTSRLVPADTSSLVTNQYFDNSGVGSLNFIAAFGGAATSTGVIDIASDATFALLTVAIWADNSLTVSNGGIGAVALTSYNGTVTVGSGLAFYYFCLQNPPTGTNIPFTWSAGGWGNTYVHTNVISFRRIGNFSVPITTSGSGTDLLHVTNGPPGRIYVQTFMTRDQVIYAGYTPKERFRAQESSAFTAITGEGSAGNQSSPVVFSAKTNVSSLWGSMILPLNTL